MMIFTSEHHGVASRVRTRDFPRLGLAAPVSVARVGDRFGRPLPAPLARLRLALSYTESMPILEYVCDACDHAFETLHRGQEEVTCPACASARLTKQLSVFAVSTPRSAVAAPAAGPCGSFGDPRGPGRVLDQLS